MRLPGLTGLPATVAPAPASPEAEALPAPAGRADGTPPSWCAQLRILLRKRWTVARRDRKAFLSQQVAPVGLVALVMLILTENVPLSGPAIPMNAALYSGDRAGATAGSDQTQLLHNAPPPSPPPSPAAGVAAHLVSHLNTSALSLQSSTAATSAALGTQLLDEYNNHSRHIRMGALVFDDTIHATIGLNLRTPPPPPSPRWFSPSSSLWLDSAPNGCCHRSSLMRCSPRPPRSTGRDPRRTARRRSTVSGDDAVAAATSLSAAPSSPPPGEAGSGAGGVLSDDPLGGALGGSTAVAALLPFLLPGLSASAAAAVDGAVARLDALLQAAIPGRR